MARPRVSVLMSVYNGERFLHQAIESILRQTLVNLEFIIVDDGSNDRTPRVLEEFAEEDSRVVLVKNEENLGLTLSLNAGLQAARGEYIARQDSDDFSLPNRLVLQAQFLDEHPEVGVLGTWVLNTDEKDNEIDRWETPIYPGTVRWSLLFGNALVHGSVMIRRSVLPPGPAYRSRILYAQDYDLWSRLSFRTELANLPEVLLIRRVHPDMVTKTHSSGQEHTAKNVMRHQMAELLADSVSGAQVDSVHRATWDPYVHTSVELRQVGRYILRLHRAYLRRHSLSGEEIRWVKQDVADRLTNLAARHARLWPVSSGWLLTLAAFIDGPSLSRLDSPRNLAGRLPRVVGHWILGDRTAHPDSRAS